jgi:hypothetical protein
MNRPAARGGRVIDNAVNMFLVVLEAAQRSRKGGTGDGDSSFWLKAVRELLSNALAALYHAYGRITLDELFTLVSSTPNSEEQAHDPEFQRASFCYRTMQRLYTDPAVPLPEREAALIVAYFGRQLAQLDPKTRSNIVISLTAEISPFLKGPLHTLFCTDTTIVPEVTHEGVILVLDLPVKEFDHVGTVAQMLFKYLWQKATERREVHEGTRPVFLWADECQFFVSDYDAEFQSTARSARAATVYLTQNLPALYHQLGGAHPTDAADAIIGGFSTKLFLSNTEHRTNQWAAETIGRAMQRRTNRTWSVNDGWNSSESDSANWSRQTGKSRGRSWGWSSGGSWGVSSSRQGGVSYSSSQSSGSQSGGNFGTSESISSGVSQSRSSGTSGGSSEGAGWSEQMDYAIQPAFFANGLRQGGPRNDFIVTGILLQANRVFSRTGTCWTPVAFKQK